MNDLLNNPLIIKGLETLKEKKDPDESGVYRSVYEFTHENKRFVIKEDRPVIGVHSNGCFKEWQKWRSNCKKPNFLQWFAPVLAAGSIHNPEEEPKEGSLCWIIMPWRQTIASVIEDYRRNFQVRYLREHIYPKMKKDYPNATLRYNSVIHINGISSDLHWENWGRSEEGQWQAFDYGND